ncbi:MAG: hypothetical protein FWD97_10065 [Defluviitaleaceae bacterium]|nr:hypothetical protein [Defluviitaleaceae bacterium]
MKNDNTVPLGKAIAIIAAIVICVPLVLGGGVFMLLRVMDGGGSPAAVQMAASPQAQTEPPAITNATEEHNPAVVGGDTNTVPGADLFLVDEISDALVGTWELAETNRTDVSPGQMIFRDDGTGTMPENFTWHVWSLYGSRYLIKESQAAITYSITEITATTLSYEADIDGVGFVTASFIRYEPSPALEIVHDDVVPDEDSSVDEILTADAVSGDMPAGGSLRHLGEPMSFEEARRLTGMFVKYQDAFIPLRTVGISFNQWPRDHRTILHDADYEVQRIPNDAQLVLIGITEARINEMLYNGWTIPYMIRLVPRSDSPSTVSIRPAQPSGSIHPFETLNGVDPIEYRARLFNPDSGQQDECMFIANPGEEFTFGAWRGTNWVEVTHVADTRFFTRPLQGSGRSPIGPDFEIVRTLNGYFEVNFTTPPLGYNEITLIHNSRVAAYYLVEFISAN